MKNTPENTGYSTGLKMVIVGLLVLICTIPTFLVYALVYDRQNRQNEAVYGIEQGWGYGESISGPQLIIPVGNSRVVTINPAETDVNIKMEVQLKKRGIYEYPVYTAAVSVKGVFNLNKISATSQQLQDSALKIGADWMRITDSARVNWGQGKILTPKIQQDHLNRSIIAAPVTLSPSLRWQPTNIPFSYNFTMQGSGRIGWQAESGSNKVTISGNWPSPSFSDILPVSSTLTKDSFTAAWNQVNSGLSNNNQNNIMVSLLQPVDIYSLTERAAKYAVLLIALTFLVYFVAEAVTKTRVHPFSYILVGAALGLFYLLLLSLAEHIGFLSSYLISAGVTTGLIGWYSGSFLRKNNFAAIVTGLLILLYCYLYMLLQLQDFALLFGSILLFAVLAATMFVTRKIDWYGERG